jgi:hypothetical protein
VLAYVLTFAGVLCTIFLLCVNNSKMKSHV